MCSGTVFFFGGISSQTHSKLLSQVWLNDLQYEPKHKTASPWETHQYQRIMRSRGIGKGCWGTKRRLCLQKSPCKKHIHLCIYTACVVSPIYVVCWPKTSAPSQKVLSTERTESEHVEKSCLFYCLPLVGLLSMRFFSLILWCTS